MSSSDDPFNSVRKRGRGRPKLDAIFIDEYGPMDFLPSDHPALNHTPTPLAEVDWGPIPEGLPPSVRRDEPDVAEFHALSGGTRYRLELVPLALEAQRLLDSLPSGKRRSRAGACKKIVNAALDDGRLPKTADFDSSWRALYDLILRWERS